MQFNKYLENLLGSKVKVKILRVLFRFNTKTFTSRELAENIKVSHTAVSKSLDSLLGMNIIKIERHGTSNLITLNHDSYVYETLETVFNFERETFEKFKAKIKNLYPQAEYIRLFGSIAKKEERMNSDIDILIVAKDKEEVRKIIAEKQEEFSKKFGNMISALILTPAEFEKKKNTPLIRRIKEHSILLKGKES